MFQLKNTSPPIDQFWENVVAGCYVDTMDLDTFSQDGCNSNAQKLPPQLPSAIVFTVGDIVNRNGYTFSQAASVVWSGDCVGSGTECAIYGRCDNGANRVCPALGAKTATARVTYMGITKLYTITGYDDTYYDNPI